MRALFCVAVAVTLLPSLPAGAESPAENLIGNWFCEVEETETPGMDEAVASNDDDDDEDDVEILLTYHRSYDWMIGEVRESNGAALLDVWLDDDTDGLSLRRIISYDATSEMKLIESSAERMVLEGEMRHILGTTTRVREEFTFADEDEFRAIWLADQGKGWYIVVDRSCERY